MKDPNLTTVQIDRNALARLKELAREDDRTAPAEIRWLIASELLRRVGIPAIQFTGKGEEIGKHFAGDGSPQ